MKEDIKQDTHKNQHFLPETYIKQFKCNSLKGGASSYVFNKITSNAKQRKFGFQKLKAKRLCAEFERHTLIVNGERELVIEECYNLLENTHKEFISMLSFYYISRKKFSTESIKNKNWAISKKNSFFKIERIVSPYYRCHPAGFVMIKNEVLSKIARFYIRIMLYRNKKFDDDLSLKHRPKLNEIAMSLNQLPSYLNKSIGSEIITIEQRTEFFELIGLLSEEVSGIDRSILNDLISAYYKIHRYLVIPFVYTGFDFTKKNIYIFFAPKKNQIISSDAPYILNSDTLVFTLTPNVAIIFSSKDFNSIIYKLSEFSDIICKCNVENAEEFIFSNDSERLIKFTKNLNPMTLHEKSKINKCLL